MGKWLLVILFLLSLPFKGEKKKISVREPFPKLPRGFPVLGR
jgi:hypothetical protein